MSDNMPKQLPIEDGLLSQLRNLTNAGNVHDVNGMISAYSLNAEVYNEKPLPQLLNAYRHARSRIIEFIKQNKPKMNSEQKQDLYDKYRYSSQHTRTIKMSYNWYSNLKISSSYPFSEKESYYRNLSDDSLRFALNDAREARDNQQDIEGRGDNPIGPGGIGVKNYPWRQDDVLTILKIMKERGLVGKTAQSSIQDYMKQERRGTDDVAAMKSQLLSRFGNGLNNILIEVQNSLSYSQDPQSPQAQQLLADLNQSGITDFQKLAFVSQLLKIK